MKYLQLSDAEGMMLKIISGCICFFLLVLTACVCMILQRQVDASFLWPIIAVICGFAGISSFDFKQFRKSDYGAIERQGEADAKVAAATKAAPPTPVVQPPAAAVEIHS
jgi:hypothetical protein